MHIEETITLTLPRSTIQDVVTLSSDLNDRMHALLERNTDDNLTSIEKSELETLVRMAHVSQILSMALPQPGGR
jgi:hypothetical protein